MDRKTAVDLLPDYVRGRLARGQRDAVAAMVAADPALAQECAELKEYFASLASVPKEKAPAGFALRVMRRIRTSQEKPSIAARLFKPFYIKLPLEAAAVLVTAVLIMIIYYPRQRASFQLADKGAAVEKTVARTEAPSLVQSEETPASDMAKPKAKTPAAERKVRRPTAATVAPQKPEATLAMAEKSADDKKPEVEPEARAFAPEAPEPAGESAAPQPGGNAVVAQTSPPPEAPAASAPVSAARSSAAAGSAYADKAAAEPATADEAESPVQWELAWSAADEPAKKDKRSVEREKSKPAKSDQADAPAELTEENPSPPVERIVRSAGGEIIRMEPNGPDNAGTRYTISIPESSAKALAAALSRHGTLSAPHQRPGHDLRNRITIVLIVR